MNSKACGESPSMFLRCSAATSLGRVSVYVMICFKLSSSRGSSCCKRGTAHDSRDEAMVPSVCKSSSCECFVNCQCQSKKSSIASRLTYLDRHTTTFPLDNDALSQRSSARLRATHGGNRKPSFDHVTEMRKRERSGASIIV
jgi:hypothetical protein